MLVYRSVCLLGYLDVSKHKGNTGMIADARYFSTIFACAMHTKFP